MPDPLTLATLDAEQRQLLAILTSGPRASFLGERPPDGWALPGPFGPMLLAPGVGNPLQALGAALRYGGALPDVTRELAIVATAAACGSRYELEHHLPLAREAGVPEELLEIAVADRDGGPHDGAAVVLACRQLARTGTVDLALFSTLEEELGQRQAFELLVLVGYYRILATVLAVYKID